MKRSIRIAMSMFVASASLFAPPGGAIQIFSQGLLNPETISLAPATFGAFGGTYLVPDPARSSADPTLHKIWSISPADGAATVFHAGSAGDTVDNALGGLFLPSNWGSEAGKFMTTGYGTAGFMYTYDETGSRELFLTIPGNGFSVPRVAPDGFGPNGEYAGQVVVTGGNQDLIAIAPDKTVTAIVSGQPAFDGGFGLAFAPPDWGSVGGKLLISNATSNFGEVISVGGDGSISPTPLVTLPLSAAPGSGGRQMEFSPPGFLPGYGTLLFVSISGSATGGGSLGNIFAVDDSGDIVASLRDDLLLTKFDPRGMFFTDRGELLISDSSDPILLATAADFRLVNAPEPATIALLMLGMIGFRLTRRNQA